MTIETGAFRKAALCGTMLLPLFLSACTSTGDPTMGISPPEAMLEAGGMPSMAGGAAPTTAAGRPGAAQGGPIQFLPVVGAPADKVAILSQALASSAAQSGIAILPSEGAVAPVRLKGYLSALSEGSATVVVFVWDIVDAQGTRISRIQGQERVSGTAADPWSVVGPDALAAIAARTMDEFRRTAPLRRLIVRRPLAGPFAATHINRGAELENVQTAFDS